MNTCPRCGSDRYRGAPFPILGALADRIMGRRRYRCAACGLSRWSHRLSRRHGVSAQKVTDERSATSAYSFFVIIVAFMALTGAAAASNCHPNDPRGTMDAVDR